MTPARSRLFVALFFCLPASRCLAQTTAPPAPAPLKFDVASIRLSKPGEGGLIKALPGGHGYTAVNIPVKLMISVMYRVPMRQIEGGPAWLDSDRYDVEARVDGQYSIEELHVMFQNLLADRFHLKFHIVPRPGNVYALSVEKPGRLAVSQSEDKYDIPISFGADGAFLGRRVPMAYFCWWLGGQLQQDSRPVIDQTGLTQFYDFKLSFAPDLPAEVDPKSLPPGTLDRPSLFNALRDQLGLKLTPQKGSVPYYVIDGIDRPSEN